MATAVSRFYGFQNGASNKSPNVDVEANEHHYTRDYRFHKFDGSSYAAMSWLVARIFRVEVGGLSDILLHHRD